MNRRRPAASPRLECLEGRLMLSVMTPAQVDSAYGLNAITFSKGAVKGNGAGQTIAIVDAYNDPSIYGDLAAFDARNGLANPTLAGSLPTTHAAGASPTFTMLNFAGNATDPGWNEEEALDVEMAHAAAPGANIVLVEASTPGLFDFITAINAVKTLPSVSVVSMSWGGPEFNGIQQFDNTFTTPAGHTGITYLASSGDSGAGAQWPSSSPNVVSVGGTSLSVTSTGTRSTESAWSGSGGGVSQFESRPSYQAKVVSGKNRSTPDVAIVADPNTGVVINSRGSQMQVGGTSLSAPVWAGLVAIADQGLVVSGHATLDGATQTLPDLYKAPSGSFFDVTTGSRASTGYDTSTGLGTPNAPALVGFLDTLSVQTTGNKNGLTTTTRPLTTIAIPSPSPSLVVAWGDPFESGASSTTTAPSLVPNLVAVPVPMVAMDPSATDEALGSFGLIESSASASVAGRSKPRG